MACLPANEKQAYRASLESDALHVLSGIVVHGCGLGHTVGMPTANLRVNTNDVIPAHGVYATVAQVGNAFYKAVTSVGHRPSVNAEDVTIETLIIDFDTDIYGESLTVYFYDYIRQIADMGSLEAVRKQVDKDCARACLCLREIIG